MKRVSAISRSSLASARPIASRAPSWPHGEHRERAVVVDDGLVAERVDELPPHPGVDRRHEPEPERRQPRREHRHRDHHATQSALTAVLLHELEVGDPVGAADLVELAALRLVVERRDEVRDDVLDRDRLRLHANPPGVPSPGASRRAPAPSRTTRCRSRSRSRRAARSSARPTRAGSRPPPGANAGDPRARSRDRARRGRRASGPGVPRRRHEGARRFAVDLVELRGSSSSSGRGRRRCQPRRARRGSCAGRARRRRPPRFPGRRGLRRTSGRRERHGRVAALLERAEESTADVAARAREEDQLTDTASVGARRRRRLRRDANWSLGGQAEQLARRVA